MKKRTPVDAAEEQRLAVHYNNELLREAFSSAICFEISKYLALNELVALYLTCGYFYRTNILDTSFNKYLNFFPAINKPPSSAPHGQVNRQRETQESQTTSFECIKRRIELLMGWPTFCRAWTIKRWLLIDRKQFHDDDKLFLEKKAYIHRKDCIMSANLERVNAYQFFSYIGSVKHMLMLREYIDNRDLEQKLLEEDDFSAFRLAAIQRNVGVLKLLFEFVDVDSSLKKQLLESSGYSNGFFNAASCAAIDGCDDAVKLLWYFIDDNECRKLMLSEGCLKSAFFEGVERGNVKIVKLFLGFVTECDACMTRKFTHEALRSADLYEHFEVVKLLWEMVDDEALKDEVLNKCVWAGNVEAIKFLWDKKYPSYNSMFNSCTLT